MQIKTVGKLDHSLFAMQFICETENTQHEFWSEIDVVIVGGIADELIDFLPLMIILTFTCLMVDFICFWRQLLYLTKQKWL